VHEVVRQIRLRNLGGIIVVDFIDMEEKKNRQRVMVALEEALRVDRSPSKVLQFNDFGLVAITRKRTQPSLERTLCKPCTYCNGSGWSKSPETICYDVQQELKKMAHMLEGKEITIRLNPEVAKVLKSGEFVSIPELEDWTKKDIIVKSDPLLHEEHFDIF
jgi:Ribonuclease G/E